MKKRGGFAAMELPMVLGVFGAGLIAVGAGFRGAKPLVAWPLMLIGAAFCLPLLIFLCVGFFLK